MQEETELTGFYNHTKENIDVLMPQLNGRHFTDDIFKPIPLYYDSNLTTVYSWETNWHNSALDQVMARRGMA